MKIIGPLVLLAMAVAACGDSGTEPEPEPEPEPQVSELQLTQVASGLTNPVHLTAPAGDTRLFVVEQVGRIRIVEGGNLRSEPFLDISSLVSSGGERGLLSVAFDPSYASTGFFWVDYTDVNGDTRVVRYRVSSDPNVADPASATVVIAIAQPFANHNGGQIAFGPDGMLYVGMGDGGSGGDPLDNGQDRSTLLGDLLRLDVRSATPYAIPADNPYRLSTTFRPEIWASGLRNPWRFSFDRTAGTLYIADVGQEEREEINAVSPTSAGLNYGWAVMEGTRCYRTASCDPAGLTLPVHEYTHADGCSITGGYVYRGTRLTGLQGTYFYSDYCFGWLRSFVLQNGTATNHLEWDVGTIGHVTSFGEDAAGELYVLVAEGHVSRIDPRE
jgi:glucose/arabinose dehydrogenase